jgi:hypothetical protein
MAVKCSWDNCEQTSGQPGTNGFWFISHQLIYCPKHVIAGLAKLAIENDELRQKIVGLEERIASTLH